MDTVGQAPGLPTDPRLNRHSPGVEAGGRCSPGSCRPLALGKVRLICEGCRERSQLWCQNNGQEGLLSKQVVETSALHQCCLGGGRAQEKGTEERP